MNTQSNSNAGSGCPATPCSRLSEPAEWCRCDSPDYRTRGLAICCQNCGGEQVPQPGSWEARNNGCKCPVLDNAHGKGYMGLGDVFVFNESCPLHFPENDPGMARRPDDGGQPESRHESEP